MKKLILTTILITTLTQLQAQVSFGVKAGLNYANLNDKTDEPKVPLITGEYRIAYHVGLVSDFELSNKISLATELLLSNKGFKGENSSRLALLYLNIPILINYYITEKISVHAGPELGIKLSSRGKGYDYNVDMSNIYDKSFDLGASLGLTYQATEKFLLTFRYTRGFLTVLDGFIFTDDGSGGDEINTRVYNSNFQLSLSYLFLKN